MFTFIFKGKLYQAKTLKELSAMLKKVGCTEDVESLYVTSFNNQEIDSKIVEDLLEQADEENKQNATDLQQIEEDNFKAAMEALKEEEDVQYQAAIDLNLTPDPKKLD